MKSQPNFNQPRITCLLKKLLAIPLPRKNRTLLFACAVCAVIPCKLLKTRNFHDLKTGTITGPHALPLYLSTPYYFPRTLEQLLACLSELIFRSKYKLLMDLLMYLSNKQELI